MSSLTIVCVIIIYSFKYLDTCYLPKMNVKLKKLQYMKKNVHQTPRAVNVKHPGKYHTLQKRYKALLEENARLRKENSRLCEDNGNLRFLLYIEAERVSQSCLKAAEDLNVDVTSLGKNCLEEIDSTPIHNTSCQLPSQQVDSGDGIAFEYKGYQCRILKQSWFGKDNYLLTGQSTYSTSYYSGYVVIPQGHPFYQMDYFDIPVEVHGGITFGQTIILGAAILSDLVGKFVIGFDCGHLGDTIEKCNVEYVKRELERLVDQLIKAAEK